MLYQLSYPLDCYVGDIPYSECYPYWPRRKDSNLRHRPVHGSIPNAEAYLINCQRTYQCSIIPTNMSCVACHCKISGSSAVYGVFTVGLLPFQTGHSESLLSPQTKGCPVLLNRLSSNGGRPAYGRPPVSQSIPSPVAPNQCKSTRYLQGIPRLSTSPILWPALALLVLFFCS